MAKVWTPQPREVLEHWIKSIDVPSVQRRLTEWESHFIASISFQLERTGTVSQKQQEILERIYSEKTS